MSKGFDINRVLSNYQSRTQGRFDVVATLYDSAEITPELSKVLIGLSTASNDRDKNFQAVANLFNNELRAVEGSFRVVPSTRAHLLVGFVTRNSEVREVTTAALQKYKVLAGNLLMDEEDSSLWELKNVNGSKYLSRKTEENLSDLVQFASLKHNHELRNVGTLKHMVMAAVEEGEYAAFVSAESLDVCAGYVLASEGDKLEVLCAHNKQVEIINKEQLIESTFVRPETAAEIPAPKQGNKEAMKEYYKRMFSYSPEYYEKMAAIIDGNSAI